MTKLEQLETIIRVLERSNEALTTSSGVLITDNTLFHDKIRQNNKADWVNSLSCWKVAATGHLDWKWCYKVPRTLECHQFLYYKHS